MHVFGACLFIGNILVCSFWKVIAERTKQVENIKFALRTLFLADGFITVPSVLILYFTGRYIAAAKNLNITLTLWIHYAIILFGISGIIWLFALIPIQILQLRSIEGDKITSRFWFYSRLWIGTALIAKLLPLTILHLMIFRPVAK